MQNIELRTDGTLLWIGVDLAAEGTRSKSGKSDVIGSTQGNATVMHEGVAYKVGVNVFKPAE